MEPGAELGGVVFGAELGVVVFGAEVLSHVGSHVKVGDTLAASSASWPTASRR